MKSKRLSFVLMGFSLFTESNSRTAWNPGEMIRELKWEIRITVLR